MPRYLIRIEYDGTNYVGWQRQENGASVQAELEDAASIIGGKRGDILVYGAGRTDAGVHATGQAAHLDLPKGFKVDKLPLALNAQLPRDIRVLSACEVADEFHARFDAIERVYQYRLLSRRVGTALDDARVWHVAPDLDVAAMNAAASHLIGEHDFTTFRAAHCQAPSPVKKLDRLSVAQDGDAVSVDAAARSFLHHQVRNITGTLVQVGLGKWKPDDVHAALKARDRKAGGPTAPAHGLYLTEVRYPGRED
jgi:tRNA pseudouridine38-40 synthase